ncbi:MAG: hypothetical protein ABIP65_09350 [Vicinamibacterales bacterium]
MRKVLSAMCMATMFGVGAGLSAQAGSMAKDQMDKKDMMKDGPVTVSGCIAAGMETGHFMLTNAMMMSHAAMDKDTMAKPMEQDKMAHPAMAEHTMSYELVGGKDLKAHMGHKVEVTGNLSKSDMDRMGKMDKMDKMDKDKMMADKDMKAMKLNVKSVKMVSATCS